MAVPPQQTLPFGDPVFEARLRTAARRGCPRWALPYLDDILQQARTAIHDASVRHRRTFGTELPSSHQWRIAYTSTIDEIRRLSVRRSAPLQPERSAEDDTKSPERRSYAAQIGRAIRECLSRMNITRRQGATLRLQGHSIKEVGQVLGWSTKKADNTIYRGMDDLRVCLERKGVRP